MNNPVGVLMEWIEIKFKMIRENGSIDTMI